MGRALPKSDSTSRITRTRLGICALIAVALTVSACGTSSPATSKAAKPSGEWPYPNGDLANDKVAPASVISSANISKLKEAWTLKLAGKGATNVDGAGSFAANPVVVNGVVYIQDLEANVYAVDLATGKLKWEYPVNIPEASGPGPDGVAVANGTVYGDSSTAVFALSAATGKPVWVDSHLLSNGDGKFEIQPQAANGRVYISSAYGDGPGGGVVMALDAATGKRLWSFNTIRTPDPAVQAIGAGAGGTGATPVISACASGDLRQARHRLGDRLARGFGGLGGLVQLRIDPGQVGGIDEPPVIEAFSWLSLLAAASSGATTGLNTLLALASCTAIFSSW